MPSPKINKILNIEYQILKEYEITDFTDEQLVYFAQGILNGIIDGTDAVVDANMPATLLGVTLDWSEGTENDKVVKITKGAVSISQDLTALNVTIPGLDIGEDYIAALNVMRIINGEIDVPDAGYIETDRATTLVDALDMAVAINGGV